MAHAGKLSLTYNSSRRLWNDVSIHACNWALWIHCAYRTDWIEEFMLFWYHMRGIGTNCQQVIWSRGSRRKLTFAVIYYCVVWKSFLVHKLHYFSCTFRIHYCKSISSLFGSVYIMARRENVLICKYIGTFILYLHGFRIRENIYLYTDLSIGV